MVSLCVLKVLSCGVTRHGCCYPAHLNVIYHRYSGMSIDYDRLRAGRTRSPCALCANKWLITSSVDMCWLFSSVLSDSHSVHLSLPGRSRRSSRIWGDWRQPSSSRCTVSASAPSLPFPSLSSHLCDSSHLAPGVTNPRSFPESFHVIFRDKYHTDFHFHLFINCV